MILNKSAVERGLGHATMLKTEQVDLSKESGAAHSFTCCVTQNVANILQHSLVQQ